jgi:hypothetical protein
MGWLRRVPWKGKQILSHRLVLKLNLRIRVNRGGVRPSLLCHNNTLEANIHKSVDTHLRVLYRPSMRDAVDATRLILDIHMAFYGRRGRLGPSPMQLRLQIGRKGFFGRLLHLPEKILKTLTKSTSVTTVGKGSECPVIWR